MRLLSLLAFLGSFLSLGALPLPVYSGNHASAIVVSQSVAAITQAYPKVPRLLLIAGKDSTAVLVPQEAFPLLSVQQIDTTWDIEAPHLPPVCSIRDIAALYFQANGEKSLPHLKGKELLRFHDFIQDWLSVSTYLGQSTKENITVRKYKLHSLIMFPLSTGSAIIQWEDGSELHYAGNSIPILLQQGSYIYHNKAIRLIWENAPAHSKRNAILKRCIHEN